ncbi:hypothetical protein [Pulveribacter sp.]|uniref:hypothetical protein n=1 Tax=Pulveribacter sp. TaxID=2678893 RepID=UPI0028AED2E0|nr:hypothetical protein [Pulveribacter sp.]
MSSRVNMHSQQSGTYRATVPLARAQRASLQTMVRAAGARSFIDLMHIVLQQPEQAGQALAPLVHAIAGEQRKREAIAKLKALAEREGVSLHELHGAFFGDAPLAQAQP